MNDLSPIEDALKDIKEGKIVIVVDDMSEDTEGNLIKAAELVTPEDINFMSREAGGLLAVAGTPEKIEQLGLELIGLRANTLRNTNFGVTIDAREGTTSGDSAGEKSA